MSLVLDHLAVVGETLEAATAHVEDLLGVTLEPGGVHDVMGTHNRLLSLGPGVYLEAIAINPEADTPKRARWFNLDQFNGPPRLGNWIARTEDLTSALAAAPRGTGVPLALQRGRFMWTMAVPASGQLPYDAVAPALIQWDCAAHPADVLPDRGCRLKALMLTHPQARGLQESFPDLGSVPLVRIREGETPSLMAVIETPDGEVVLE